MRAASAEACQATFRQADVHCWDLLCLQLGVWHLNAATVYLELEIAELHAHLIPQLAGLARNLVRDLDPQASHTWTSQPRHCLADE